MGVEIIFFKNLFMYLLRQEVGYYWIKCNLQYKVYSLIRYTENTDVQQSNFSIVDYPIIPFTQTLRKRGRRTHHSSGTLESITEFLPEFQQTKFPIRWHPTTARSLQL